MNLNRREIVCGLMAGAGAIAFAAPEDQTPEDQTMYGTIGKMTVAAGKRAEVIALLLQAVKGMPGCLSYVVAEDRSDENGIWITEVWDSKESHDASLALPEVRKAIAAARPVIVGFSNQVVTTPAGGFGLVSDSRPSERIERMNPMVIVSGGFAPVLREILPEFQKSTGIEVEVGSGQSQGNGPNTIAAQLRRGVAADVVIMAREGLNELIADGRIAAGTDVDLAQTPLGVAVRTGARRPDIGTVDAFQQAMLRAKSVTFPGSTTGIYLATKLFPQLGIAAEMAGKISNTGVSAVAKGDAEIAVQPVSELLHISGVDYVGTIPTEIQYISVFSAAIVAGSKDAEAAKRLIAYLVSKEATPAIRQGGMERPPQAR